MTEEGQDMASRSQPCADAQERSPEALHSGGLSDLLARVEAATADDQAELLWAACRHFFPADGSLPTTGSAAAFRQRFARMLDAGGYESAALALVERVLPGVWYWLGRGKNSPTEPLYGALLLFGEEEIGAGEHEQSAALALIAALLKALIAQEASRD